MSEEHKAPLLLRMKLPHASTNDLRRTFCSWCWQDGIPLEVCAEWLGHEGIRMARTVYAHMSREAGAARYAAGNTAMLESLVTCRRCKRLIAERRTFHVAGKPTTYAVAVSLTRDPRAERRS